MEEKKITRPNKRQKTVRNQTYEVTKDGLVGFIPRSKDERKKLLKRLVSKAFQTRWQKVPQNVYTLEQTIINELIDNI